MKIATFVNSLYRLPLSPNVVDAPISVATAIGDGLVARGHEVTFYALESPDSKFSVVSGALNQPLHKNQMLNSSGADSMLERDSLYQSFDLYLLSLLYQDARAGKYDVIHLHRFPHALPFAELCDVPTVYTVHDPMLEWKAWLLSLYSPKNRHFVSVSDAQRPEMLKDSFERTIYNGISLDTFSFSDANVNGYLFAGRLTDEKGVAEAAEATNIAGLSLRIIGKLHDGHRKYWQERVAPQLNDRVKAVEPLEGVSQEVLADAYRESRALLLPLQWEEPFGLVMIEAMACGTPVIAFNRGSVSEIIEDGVTGYIVDPAEGVEGFAAAMERMERLSESDYRAMRVAARKRVEAHFSTEKMVDAYESLFKSLVK